MSIEPNCESYLRSISAELQSTAHRIRYLIGDAHFLSDGHHKEYVLRSVLKRFLPCGLICARGFVVRDHNLHFVSTEQDILIVDVRKCAPLFYESDVVVSFPENIKAAISVKTTLDSSNLRDALQGLATIPQIDNPRQPWKGIFAYKFGDDWVGKSYLPKRYLETFGAGLSETELSAWKGAAVCVDNQFLMKIGQRDVMDVKGYESDLVAALFIGLLVEQIATDREVAGLGLSGMIAGTTFAEI